MLVIESKLPHVEHVLLGHGDLSETVLKLVRLRVSARFVLDESTLNDCAFFWFHGNTTNLI